MEGQQADRQTLDGASNQEALEIYILYPGEEAKKTGVEEGEAGFGRQEQYNLGYQAG